MYLFYDEYGKFIYSCEAPLPIAGLVKRGKLTGLYLDDVVDKHVIENYPDYTYIGGEPVYTPIPDSVNLPYVQQSKIEEINIACNLDILNGFASSCTGVEHSYKFNEEWQTNFNREMNSLLLNPTILSLNWTTKDDGVMVHTREQFIILYAESKLHIDTKMARYYEMRDQIMAAQTTTQVKEFAW